LGSQRAWALAQPTSGWQDRDVADDTQDKALVARIDRMEERIDRLEAEINELFTRLQGSYKGQGPTFGPGAPIRPTPPGPADPKDAVTGYSARPTAGDAGATQ
jgi:hypothetical protein